MRDLPPNTYEPQLPEGLDDYLDLPPWPDFLKPQHTDDYREITEPDTSEAAHDRPDELVPEETDAQQPYLGPDGGREHFRHRRRRLTLGRLIFGDPEE